MTADLVRGDDGLLRCRWGASPEIYRHYHDDEWGREVTDEDALFERVSLEAFQSGLSWLTILRKRDAFRSAFRGFHIAEVARFTDDDVEQLLTDKGIVRNRAKIEATVNNARVAASMSESLSSLLWSFAPDATARHRPVDFGQVPAVTVESTAMAKRLKKLGFRFVGPTTAYALMQATGMVDDHLAGCHVAARDLEGTH
ncbi:DNA-3-methyladenine glycosylase I [Stackebrandtia endophytica]|uniref:DNA-3-methyladenine glycosylase I n=1 Tax=Stackebrandtia endophytica TaxID=1496996 RepID=A0A543AU75_9ACTN|nr:DNA-3-methyladenine glycosylase I [Stackebrandtia endophytica]TQL76134.1 DNA-3-methyladenine glycosylase I [Stackebrandtia endophytica]